MKRNVLNVVVIVALCLVGISACTGPTAPPNSKFSIVYVPATISVVQGKTVDLEPTLDGKNVQPSSCSTPAGTAQVVFENGKHIVRVTAIVVGVDHKVTCSVAGANDGFAKVTVTEPPLIFDVEYSASLPETLDSSSPGGVVLHIGGFIFNGEPGNAEDCRPTWIPPTNKWICRNVGFVRTTAYYVKAADGRRWGLETFGPNYGRDITLTHPITKVRYLLTRVSPYFTLGEMVRLDFDSNGNPR